MGFSGTVFGAISGGGLAAGEAAHIQLGRIQNRLGREIAKVQELEAVKARWANNPPVDYRQVAVYEQLIREAWERVADLESRQDALLAGEKERA